MPQFRYREFYCFRRFKDFDYLYTKLCNSHNGVIVPPLPDKGVIGALSDLSTYATSGSMCFFICFFLIMPIVYFPVRDSL